MRIVVRGVSAWVEDCTMDWCARLCIQHVRESELHLTYVECLVGGRFARFVDIGVLTTMSQMGYYLPAAAQARSA
jgi:hypothetical protein